MENLITWLTGTSTGLVITGFLIAYFVSEHKKRKSQESKVASSERKKVKNENTIVITETKVTKIKKSNNSMYEKNND